MNKCDNGNLFIISGPSGVGKDTLMALILDKFKNLNRWVTVTTRKPRKGEIEGKDYFYRSKVDVEDMIKNNELVEWNNYSGNIYGTPKFFVENNLCNGNDIITCIDVNGAMNVKKFFPQAISIFILPPSIDELRNRLKNRNTESNLEIENRIKIVSSEIDKSSYFDYQVINDQLDTAVNAISDIIINNIK